jgi:hypothetical protein
MCCCCCCCCCCCIPLLNLYILYYDYYVVWSQIRDDTNKDVDWLLIGYDGNSKTNMTVFDQGNGGMAVLSSKLPEGEPVFGGVRLSKGRFVHFLYLPEGCSAIKRGRTLMYKNGEF